MTTALIASLFLLAQPASPSVGPASGIARRRRRSRDARDHQKVRGLGGGA